MVQCERAPGFPHSLCSCHTRLKWCLIILTATAMADALLMEPGAAPNILASPFSLTKNQYLHRADQNQSLDSWLVMQGDCNLVIYRGSSCCSDPQWQTGINGKGSDCYVTMQGDGNLVIYLNSTAPVWASQTFAGSGRVVGVYFLILEQSSLSILQSGKPSSSIWTSSANGVPDALPPALPLSLGFQPYVTSGQYMPVGYSLNQNSSLGTADGQFQLTWEPECNLRVLRNGSQQALWETMTGGSGTHCQLILLATGELQILNDTGVAVWRSNVSGDPYKLYLFFLDENDGNLLVYDDLRLQDKTVWTALQNDSALSLPPGPGKPKKKGYEWWVLFIIVASSTVALLLGTIITFWALTYYGFSKFFDSAEKELHLRLRNVGGKVKVLSSSKIKQATKNFERKLGEGGFGPVFYGRLEDGQEVAVKALSATSHQGKQEFLNEIELLSVVYHKYLVSLVGYSLGWNQRMLVYEYMTGGDLRVALHGESAATNPLSWKQRTNIVMQVAEGIEYLHHGCRPAIVHRDIKSTNILLTDQMVAKVADFGLSKLLIVDRMDATHITTVVKGTQGYLDPEYYVTQRLTEKSDVYAFGVLLMEILTGKSLMEDHVFIVQRVRQAWKSKQVDGVADPNLAGAYDGKEFADLVKLSLWCVKQGSSDRPYMAQVVQHLRGMGLGLLQFEAAVGQDAGPFSLEIHQDDMSLPLTPPLSESSSGSRSFKSKFSSSSISSFRTSA